MAKIFICYRREDGAYPAHQIYGDLVDHFGEESVVFDVDTIPYGTDFRDYLNHEVSKCDILLAVIGDQWIETLKQRLNETDDFIRIEIQAALERQIPVVPVLVGKASVPREKDLPKDLTGLAYKQAAEVRAGPDYRAHLKRLIEGLDYLLIGSKPDKQHKKIDEKKRENLKKTYTNTIGMEFVLIPAGSFVMGSSAVFNFLKYEAPAHEVKISQSFYLQATQVTNGQWKEVMADNPSAFEDCGADCPVEKVSWDDAQEFIQKLNEKEGTDQYRLPTEAEWEYGCRAGTTTKFSFGDDAGKLGEYAWYDKNSDRKTHPVGQKKPNAWGLYDMHGNIWEWVEDDWHDSYKRAFDDGRAWFDDPRGALRVMRGGSWDTYARYCRSAIRGQKAPGRRDSLVGFRLARSVTFGL